MSTKSFNFQNNSFDLLRYFSAFSVMFLHYTYYAITESGQKIEILRTIRRMTEFFPGVVILFSLSGFLIAASRERSKNNKEYFSKRVFRLYPELWVCTLVNFGVLIIFAREYLDGSILTWLITQVFGIANTPECLTGFATGSVNGALWTIFTEVQLYVVLGFAFPFLKRIKIVGWTVILAAAAVMNVCCSYFANQLGGVVSKIIERTFFPYAIWFVIGVFCYQYKECIVSILRKYLLLFIIVFILNQRLGLCTVGYYEDIVTGLTLPFITIGVAYFLPAIRIKCDLSYGIFLYHWIIINIMVHLNMFQSISWQWCGIIFLGMTLAVAWLSWYVVGRNVRKITDKFLCRL